MGRPLALGEWAIPSNPSRSWTNPHLVLELSDVAAGVPKALSGGPERLLVWGLLSGKQGRMEVHGQLARLTQGSHKVPARARRRAGPLLQAHTQSHCPPSGCSGPGNAGRGGCAPHCMPNHCSWSAHWAASLSLPSRSPSSPLPSMSSTSSS